tara:strand:- start:2718 stop:2903 length:186 start_codon:yes stop_codon:yes gene_type:complete
MSPVLEFFLVINSVIVAALLWTQLSIARHKLKQIEKEQHSRDLVDIAGIADVFALEENNGG